MPESDGQQTTSSREPPLRRAARAIRLLHRQLREERAATETLRMAMELAAVRGVEVRPMDGYMMYEAGVARIPLPHLRMGWELSARSAPLGDHLVDIEGVPHLVVEMHRARRAEEGA